MENPAGTIQIPAKPLEETLRFERWLIVIVALIQFVNILDFMMVMPLGPDYAIALGIPIAHIGFIGGSYTMAACITGILGSLFLDNFSRKRVVLVSLCGLAIATACGAAAWDFHSLMAARILAGIFGGPLTSASLAIIADCVPPERRGRAMGKVMGAFSAASVLGVPFGLEMAHMFGWQAPFLTLALLAVIVIFMAARFLPNLDRHAYVSPGTRFKHITKSFTNRLALAAYGYTGLGMMSGFLLIPNISSHLQMNFHYPREELGLLYFAGGAVSFFGMRFVGSQLDKYGAKWVMLVATALFVISVVTGFVFTAPPIPVIIIFTFFMLAMSSRNVCAQTLSSRIPAPAERAGFMSMLSALTHFSMATGAFLSAQMLDETTQHTLDGVPQVATLAIAISLVVPFLILYVEKKLRERAA